ncbi:MAG: gliding motility-associated C-terminal domain-containing protein, partial [Flavobacteriales bacterium]|nr:gliding motility-associated C-terminal domain-containing protein [Flavobacteriales bacterium]
EDCTLKFYTGITPNGDGKNDIWIIDNIEMFPENTIRIFNRWGNQVFYETGYDNIERVWDGTGDDGELTDATYFYVAEVAGKIYKGWVELTK